VNYHHWMTNGLSAVALGQITPGPVIQTAAVLIYAAAGLASEPLAAIVAFMPSLLFVVVGARHFAAERRGH
jgi:chromate transporter